MRKHSYRKQISESTSLLRLTLVRPKSAKSYPPSNWPTDCSTGTNELFPPSANNSCDSTGTTVRANLSSSGIVRYKKRRIVKTFMCPSVVSALLSLAAQSTMAFSLDTHLYIATKVLDDALTGSISVCAGEELASAQSGSQCAKRYPIPQVKFTALKDYPSAYLAGALGPDVFPDFITSQVTVHPGLEHGWGTDDFLRHLLANAKDGADLAWVSGFLSHASSDVFAHSWVNHYAGGIFDISKHIDSNEIEVRHFVLERYIADRTSHIWSKYATTPEAPHEFVADQLMLANPVSLQFKKAGAITGHVVAIEVLHENVQRLYEDALAISRTIHEIGLKKLQPLEAAKGNLKLAEEGLKLTGKALEESESALKHRDELIGVAEQTLLDIAKIIDENPGLIAGWRLQIEQTKIAIDVQESGLEGLRDAVKAAGKLVDAAQRVLDATGATICEKLPYPLDQLCEINPAYTSAKKTLDAAKAVLGAKENLLNEALNGIASLKAATVDLDSKISEAEQAIARAKITQQTVGAQLELNRAQRKLEAETVKASRKTVEEATKLAQQAQQLLDKISNDLAPVLDLLARYDPIVLFLQHWAADIRRASVAFSKSSEGVADNLLKAAEGNALDPYFKWYECWSPVLSAVPSEVPQTVCTAKDIYTDMHDKLMLEINRVVDSLGSLGWLIAPNFKVQQEFEKKVKKPLEHEVRKAVIHVGTEVVAFLSNRELADLIQLISSKERITDARLNGIYATDDSKSRLLEIPDIATRVRRDAGLDAEADTISEDRFAALYDAIVLSKLALLDDDGLNDVYNDLRLIANPEAQPQKLFTAQPGQPFNILLNAVSSIDGNHQWQAIGLPYPVSAGSVRDWPDHSRFGRPGRSGAHSGFSFWGDPNAREMVFTQLFRGPLSPGMDSLPAISSNYPFPSCDRYPFPSTTNANGSRAYHDYTCRLMSSSHESRGSYPALTERVVKTQELSHLSKWELRVARNEIFARHGYKFGPDKLVRHFSSQPWYEPSDLPASTLVENLNRTEWRNISRIQQAEFQQRRKYVSSP